MRELVDAGVKPAASREDDGGVVPSGLDAPDEEACDIDERGRELESDAAGFGEEGGMMMDRGGDLKTTGAGTGAAAGAGERLSI
jgi:hypothetical protein